MRAYPSLLLAAALTWLLAALPCRAQQTPAFAHYWQMEAALNPAAVGRTPELNITGVNPAEKGKRHFSSPLLKLRGTSHTITHIS